MEVLKGQDYLDSSDIYNQLYQWHFEIKMVTDDSLYDITKKICFKLTGGKPGEEATIKYTTRGHVDYRSDWGITESVTDRVWGTTGSSDEWHSISYYDGDCNLDGIKIQVYLNDELVADETYTW